MRTPRRNLLDYPSDFWIPPSYRPDQGWWSRARSWLFRFFDLQASTIWDDMKAELPSARGTVLDVGCGLQPYRRFFPPEARYQGLDTVDSKSHFGYEAPDTLYYSGPAWPVRNGTIDFLLCTETLEHIQEPGRFLAEAFRCLRPGGCSLFTVPFAARWHFIPHDYWRYTPSTLEALFRQAGFTNIRVYARGNMFTVACYKVMAVIFALVFPGRAPAWKAWPSRIAGLALSPLLGLVTLAAHLTRHLDGSVDCLGYTLLADRPLPGTGRRKRPAK